MFTTREGNVVSVQCEAEEKGKKAAKAMKEITGLMQHIDPADSSVSGGKTDQPVSVTRFIEL
jgi:hypothetical protein